MRHRGIIIAVAAILSLSVAVSASAASLTLAWDAPLDNSVTGYLVYYGTASQQYQVPIDVKKVTTYTVVGLIDGTKYFFAVRSYNTYGPSDFSLEVSGTTSGKPPLTPPPLGNRPSLIGQLRSDRYIDLSWTPASGDNATSFRVEVGTLPGFTAFSASTAERFISFDMTDLIVPAYFIRVRSVNGGVLGAASNEVAVTPTIISVPNEEPPNNGCAAPPGTPRRFTANAAGPAVTLNWQRGSGDAPSGYLLEVGTAPGLKNLMTVPLGVAPGLSATATSGVYALRLLATNICGTSAWGAESVLTVGGGSLQPPGTPQNVTSQVTGNSVSFSWSAPTTGGPVSHYVLEATIGSTTYTFNTGSAMTTASFTNVPPGQYVVRLRAGNSAGTSAASTAVTVTVF